MYFERSINVGIMCKKCACASGVRARWMTGGESGPLGIRGGGGGGGGLQGANEGGGVVIGRHAGADEDALLHNLRRPHPFRLEQNLSLR